jgi:hypothetical protein
VTIRDPYSATHFEPGCQECDALWKQMRAASSAPDWQEQAQLVTARIQAHARNAHDLTLAQGGEAQ